MTKRNIADLFRFSPDEIFLLDKKLFDSIASYPSFNLFITVFHCMKIAISGFLRSFKETMWDSNKTLVFTLNPNLKKQHRTFMKIFEFPRGYIFVSRRDMGLRLFEAFSLMAETLSLFLSYFFLSTHEKKMWRVCCFRYIESRFIVKFVLRNKFQRILFHGFDYELTPFFTCLFLTRDHHIYTMFYFVAVNLNNSHINFSCEFLFPNKWMAQFAPKMKDIIHGEKITASKTLNFPFLKRRVGRMGKKNRLAYYSMGFYNREFDNVWTQSSIEEMRAEENQLVALLEKYLKEHSNLELTIFPHPGPETNQSAEHYYRHFLALPNVNLMNIENPSSDYYADYEIGISKHSATLFERLFMGYKSVLGFSGQYLEPFKTTALKHVMIADEIDSLEKIEHLRTMDDKDFFDLIGFPEALKDRV